MRAKDFIPASKPRNFVAKNQKTGGAGAHKDKKKAEKQGYEKHKKKVDETELRNLDDLRAKRKALQDLQMDPNSNDPEIKQAIMQRKADLEKEAKAKGMSEGRHGYDDAGFSLAPGHDEGEPVYNPRYDVVGRGNDRHWQPDRDQYAPRREKKGFVFYNVKDPDLASQVGLKQTKGGKWYAFTTDRFLNKSAEREFGPGKVWYPKD
jgi:hypothetical protein